jgi:hypothetical protein
LKEIQLFQHLVVLGFGGGGAVAVAVGQDGGHSTVELMASNACGTVQGLLTLDPRLALRLGYQVVNTDDHSW